MRRSSRSRRRPTAIPWMSVAVLAVLLAVSCSRTIQALFIYDSAAISNGEIWRIVTGNLVHCSGEHLFWNSFVLGAVGVTIERRGYRHFGWLALLASLAVGAALFIFQPSVLVYAGASGIAAAAVVYLAFNGVAQEGATRLWRWFCSLGLVLVSVKIGYEFCTDRSVFLHTGPTADVQGLEVCPLSHLAGALAGAALFTLTRLRADALLPARKWVRPTTLFAMTGLAPLLLTGCMTWHLWDGEMIESFHEPAAPARLALFQPTNATETDLIVQYDELSPWRDSVRRQTYFLRENVSRIERRKKPAFVDSAVTNGATSIPIIDYTNLTSNLRAAAAGEPALPCAVRLDGENSFNIIGTNGVTEGPFHLPGYRGITGNLRLVAFTPLTITADATIVGGVVAYFGLMAMAQSGGGPIYPVCK